MRKLISLLIVLGMLFVASSAFAWGGWWSCPEYNTVAQDSVGLNINEAVGDSNNGIIAVGGNYSNVGGEGYVNNPLWDPERYQLTAIATANIDFDPDKIIKSANYRYVGSSLQLYSYGELRNTQPTFCCDNGEGDVSVGGGGDLFHSSYLSGNSGGWTGGHAAAVYEAYDEGDTGNFLGFIQYGPEAGGCVTLTTYGTISRTNLPHGGLSLTALSVTTAASTGGGVID